MQDTDNSKTVYCGVSLVWEGRIKSYDELKGKDYLQLLCAQQNLDDRVEIRVSRAMKETHKFGYLEQFWSTYSSIDSALSEVAMVRCTIELA